MPTFAVPGVSPRVPIRMRRFHTACLALTAVVLGMDSSSHASDIPGSAELAEVFRAEAVIESTPGPVGTSAFRARNPWQHLQATIENEVLTVSPFDQPGASWSSATRLVAAGRGVAPPDVPEATPMLVGKRVEWQRGPMVEWIENAPRGLVHGFTLLDRFEGTPFISVTIQLDVSTSLVPRRVESARSVQYLDSTGYPVLEFGRVRAVDARGIPVSRASLSVDGSRISISFADEQSVYPITVETALFTGPRLDPEHLHPFSPLRFGSAVAIDGDTAIAGAPTPETHRATMESDHGFATVFRREADRWIKAQDLRPSDPFTPLDGPELFGSSLAIDGDIAVVGAPREYVLTADGFRAGGAAYVFERSGGMWLETARLLPDPTTEASAFGTVVSVSGDTIAVSAPYERPGLGESRGSVSVFVRTPAGAWTLQAKVRPPGPEASRQNLGWSMALSGNILVAGSPVDDLGAVNSGAVHTFVRSGAAWTPQPVLKLPDPTDYDRFGYFVDVDGSRLVTGGRGMAMVFQFDAGRWVEEQRFPVSATNDVPRVAISGDLLVAGDPADSEFAMRSGEAFVYRRGNAGWQPLMRVVAPDPRSTANFGNVVDISGRDIIIGTALADAAYLYQVIDDTGVLGADLAITSDQRVFDCGRSALLTYTITVGNLGPGRATDVCVSDDLPPGVLFFCAWSSRGSVQTPKRWHQGRVRWTLGALDAEPEDVAQLVIYAFAGRDGTHTNRARVLASSDDPDASNNSVSERYVFRVRSPTPP